MLSQRFSDMIVLVVLSLATSGCLSAGKRGASLSVPIPSSVLLESRTVDHSVPERLGRLSSEEFEAVASSVRSLRADPEELSQLVGDTIRVADLVRVLAIDSAGVVLGEMPLYDFVYSGRRFRLLSDGRVHLSRRGTIRFRARLPKRYWRGAESARPSAEVSIVVHAGAF